jgi:ABC-type transporter Mla maintaining outer membrane lipid asymmetry ATPase subunit MlaF
LSKRETLQNFALEDLTFAYDQGATIFENVSFEMPKSKAVWIRSPGGRGKSTLLRLLAGLLAPTAGRILIDGKNISDMSFEEFLGYRLNIGYGFDMGGLLNNKTIFENLILPLEYHKMVSQEEAVERVEQMIKTFGVSSSRDLRPFAVPGSQRKLTCILRAFIHQPQVVFLDDPVTGLKGDNLNDLLEYVEESFATRGLKQVFFSSESPVLATEFKAEELLISTAGFTTRIAA